jgi:beta-galactosidase
MCPTFYPTHRSDIDLRRRRCVTFSGLLLLTLLCLSIHSHSQPDPYLTRLYDQLNESPLQLKYRSLCPMPVGVVYVQREGEGEKEMRAHFKLMRELGFNSLKQIMVLPGWTIEQVQLIALEEGIIPWWYGEGGWEEITPELIKKVGLPATTTIADARSHKAMITYQHAHLKRRIERTIEFSKSTGETLKGHSTAYEPEVGGRGFDLTDEGRRLFFEWVRSKYKTIENLNRSWNQYHVGLQPSGSNVAFQSWEDFAKRYVGLSNNEYGHLKDILRFKVEHSLASIEKRCIALHEFDPHAPFRGGGEIGLFHPLAFYGVDMEGIAALMKNYGSFYPSIHFAWHFAETDYEITRPVYMQAALANDFFKGGWAATWESTGGPQQFSGGKGGAYFTVDSNVLKQFLFSQLAAGFKGWGSWTWSVRTAGWEAGEYGLLDRNNLVTDRAIVVGNIGRKVNELRDEIWRLRKEPMVGVLYDWNSEAIWAAMSVAGRSEFKDQPVKARIGISRALINANVPFEYVLSSDLHKGLASRYKVIYLPSITSMDEQLLSVLDRYVREGGRLVMDAPTAYYNQYGALMDTRKNSAFEKLFGVTIRDYQGSGANRIYSLNGVPVQGLIMDLQLTGAAEVAKYTSGEVAITENILGKGRAVVIGYEAGALCHLQGKTEAEQLLVQQCLGTLKPTFQCDDAIVYRLAGKERDHYFVINDGPARDVTLRFTHKNYKKLIEVMSGKELSLHDPVKVEGNSATWLVYEKR